MATEKITDDGADKSKQKVFFSPEWNVSPSTKQKQRRQASGFVCICFSNGLQGLSIHLTSIRSILLVLTETLHLSYGPVWYLTLARG